MKVKGYFVSILLDDDPIIYKEILSENSLAGKLVSIGPTAFTSRGFKEFNIPIGDIVIVPSTSLILKNNDEAYIICPDHDIAGCIDYHEWQQMKEKCRNESKRAD